MIAQAPQATEMTLICNILRTARPLFADMLIITSNTRRVCVVLVTVAYLVSCDQSRRTIASREQRSAVWGTGAFGSRERPFSALARRVSDTCWNGWMDQEPGKAGMTKRVVRERRCVVYTRKSSGGGQSTNSTAASWL